MELSLSATPQDFDKYESEFKVLDETELDANSDKQDPSDAEPDYDKTVDQNKDSSSEIEEEYKESPEKSSSEIDSESEDPEEYMER